MAAETLILLTYSEGDMQIRLKYPCSHIYCVDCAKLRSKQGEGLSTTRITSPVYALFFFVLLSM